MTNHNRVSRPRRLVQGRRVAATILLLLFLLAGCSSQGPQRLVSSHEGYNDAVHLVSSREVLKNVVRMRYLDPPQFISVSAINAQFSVSSGVNVGTTVGGGNAAVGTAGANVGFSDSPTITFTPVAGSDAMKSLETPLELRYMLNYILENADPSRTEIAASLIAINNAPDAPGPKGELFRRRVAALQRLFELGCRLSQRMIFYPRHKPFRAEGIDARAYVNAAAQGLYFVEVGDEGLLSVGSKHINPGLFVPDPDNPEVIEQLKIIDAKPGHDFYWIRPPEQLQVPNSMWTSSADGRVASSIYVVPRSVWSLMNAASRTVQTPPDHERSGVAPPLSEVPTNTSLELPMQIKSSSEEPSDEYRIRHRGYWFYIDDRDYSSRRVFGQLVFSYIHTLGGTAPAVPALTLPISGP